LADRALICCGVNSWSPNDSVGNMDGSDLSSEILPGACSSTVHDVRRRALDGKSGLRRPHPKD
jgi:hypothetical protein